MHLNRWTKLMHGFAFQADEDRDEVAALFDSDALGLYALQVASEGIGLIGEEFASLRSPSQMDHARTVLADHRFLGIVLEILADDQNGLAVIVALRVREVDVGRERNVSGHFLPQITELVARVPDVVAGGVDGVLLRDGVVAATARHQRAADVGLAFEHADRNIEIFARSVKVRRRRNLFMRS